MMTRWRRDARGASVVEYVLLMGLVVLVVFATIYALGRSPDKPASVLGETFNNPPTGVGPGPKPTLPACDPGPPDFTTTTNPCLPP